jgi:hypothetical protein
MNTRRNISKPRVANQAAGVANFFMYSVTKSSRLRIIKREAETVKQNQTGSA